jgi:hypothetical protein
MTVALRPACALWNVLPQVALDRWAHFPEVIREHPNLVQDRTWKSSPAPTPIKQQAVEVLATSGGRIPDPREPIGNARELAGQLMRGKVRRQLLHPTQGRAGRCLVVRRFGQPIAGARVIGLAIGASATDRALDFAEFPTIVHFAHWGDSYPQNSWLALVQVPLGRKFIATALVVIDRLA